MRTDQEDAIRAVAENVISILVSKQDGHRFLANGRDVVLAELMRELQAVMPTGSSDALAGACNRFLDQLAPSVTLRPWVEAVDPIGGSVSMR
ncbi:hypothetical protein [Methylobacterium pseudosasicola]|uniref:Uncharacterized protein n=1 Tax=Methylobacterium pseudosasicola TaxID=582667 RepID=A0A1I4TKZ6_9HYPH|nr:hypothetical protein [Methylobacterium pseudosasicola]SFM77220.1 hypothetical protein SAMN05192568_10553 [Methylobacterium pseudosasicola]